MRFSKLLRLGAVAYAGVALASEEECTGETCKAVPRPATDHVMLQVHKRFNVSKQETQQKELNLVWSDEFDGDGAPDRSKWVPETGGWGFGNNELQFYTDRTDNAYISGGTLKIAAKCDQYNGKSFTSAKLTTEHTQSWGPGHRVEVRAKLPTNQGTWPAIWMLPKYRAFGDWPKSGEIDILETVGCSPHKLYGTVHTEAYNHVIHTEKQGVQDGDPGQWRVYSIDWYHDKITWALDGNAYFTFAPSERDHAKWPFDQEFYLILNVAVGGSWGGWCLNGGWPSCWDEHQFKNPQLMEVDYVRIYDLGSSLAQE